MRMTARRARDRAGSAAVALKSMIRRAVVQVASGGLWKLGGYQGESTHDNVELFGGIGFHSRPSAASVTAGNPEVIVLRVGGSQAHPVIVATRDESVRVSLEADETAIFNSQAVVKIKSDGTIEASSIGGSPVALALKSELDALQSWADGHLHADPASGWTGTPVLTGTTTPDPAPSATGTTVLKGE